MRIASASLHGRACAEEKNRRTTFRQAPYADYAAYQGGGTFARAARQLGGRGTLEFVRAHPGAFFYGALEAHCVKRECLRRGAI